MTLSIPWYKNAIIYAVDVATFQDSNGDGIGDFPGLLSRLDYLADLGVTCLWLLPLCPSPDRDNGYDVTHYYEVDSALGTLDDFSEVVHQAGERGIRILVDLVMHHTSDEHPWFQAARRDRHSRFRSYYVWSDVPPPTESTQPVFPGEERSVWTYDQIAGAYYYHAFYHFEPNLNSGNPEVRAEILRVMDFWLCFGVSGFRLDSVNHMIDRKETSPPDGHGMLKEFRRHVARRHEDAVLLGEADVEQDKLAAFFGDSDELHMLYNFLLDSYLFLALARESAEPLARAVSLVPQVPVGGQWANFLRNLDELDLERLVEAERQDIYKAFAPEPRMRIYGRGTRRRLAPMLGERRRVEMAFSLLFSWPGAPLFVYGDEIGMGEDLSLDGRNAVRTSMQWSRDRHAGFSTIENGQPRKPVIADGGPFDYRRLNVADQTKDPESLLNWVKRLIAVRRGCPELGCGAMDVVETGEPAVFAHRCRWDNRELLAVHNLSGKDRTVTLRLHAGRSAMLAPLLSSDGRTERIEGRLLELDPYGYRWYRIDAREGR